MAPSEPVEVTIGSLLEGQVDPSNFRDIKEFVPLERPDRSRSSNFAVALATGVALSLAGFSALAIARRKRDLSPKQWVLNELAEIEASMEERISADEFYTRITDVIRQYVEREFDIAAPRLTTAQFFERVEGSDELDPHCIAILREFLETADMVKFAGFEPEGSDGTGPIGLARRFVHESCDHAQQDRRSALAEEVVGVSQ